MSVGGSINMGVLRDNWDVIAWMLVGLVSLKAGVNIALGPLFGLSKCVARCDGVNTASSCALLACRWCWACTVHHVFTDWLQRVKAMQCMRVASAQ
jgi:hypothetical protein